MHVYYAQVHEFCGLVMAAIGQRGTAPPPARLAPEQVSVFAEKLSACSTPDEARACVESDLAAALGFAKVVEDVNRRIQVGSYVLPVLRATHQPRFFALGCAVQDFLSAPAP